MADTVDAVIKVKRGLESARRSIVFASGELLYTTDTKRLFVGDGGLGGNPTSSKVFFTSAAVSTLNYPISGDFYVNTGAGNKMYVLTGSDYTSLSSYVLLTDIGTTQQTTSVVQSNSGSWINTYGNIAYSSLTANSANWQSVYSTVFAYSGFWSVSGGGGGGGTDYSAVAVVVRSTSANWNQVYTSNITFSSTWDQAYSTLVANSGIWNTNSGSFAPTQYITNSVVWNTSSNWSNAYSTVLANSGNWTPASTVVENSSGNWNQVYAQVVAASSNWGSPFTGGVPLTGGTVQTYTDPLTANGTFLVFTINGKSQGIPLWDTP